MKARLSGLLGHLFAVSGHFVRSVSYTMWLKLHCKFNFVTLFTVYLLFMFSFDRLASLRYMAFPKLIIGVINEDHLVHPLNSSYIHQVCHFLFMCFDELFVF